MEVIDTSIPGVKVIKPKVFSDERGFFMETWQQKNFEEKVLKGKLTFVQDNHSKSIKGTLRGLHYQKDNPQGKLVRVIQGEVFDVAVDVRKNSQTFGQWVGVYLSAQNRNQLWIPPGFAHGFYVTSETAEFVYKCTDYYHPEDEVCILWNDENIGVEWPIQGEVMLSAKDSMGKNIVDIS